MTPITFCKKTTTIFLKFGSIISEWFRLIKKILNLPKYRIYYMTIIKYFLTNILILSSFVIANAQLKYIWNKQLKKSYTPHSSVSLGGGTSHFYGTASTYGNPIGSTINSMRWHASINWTKHFSPKTNFRLNFSWIRLGADDAALKNSEKYKLSYLRNLHFSNDVKELSFNAIHNFKAETKNTRLRPATIPYMFAGVAFLLHNPTAKTSPELGSKWVDLQPLKTEGQGLAGNSITPYKLFTGAFMVGFGVKKKLTKKLDLGIESCIRLPFTKYLDDIAVGQADPSVFTDPIAKALSNRSLEATVARSGDDRTIRVTEILKQIAKIGPNDNPFTNPVAITNDRYTTKLPDSYLTVGLNFIYHLSPSIKCP